MNFLICYDIEDNKRRNKIASILEGYGVRVNYSVFEVKLNKTKFKKLYKEIKEVASKKDNIRFYHICKSCLDKSFELNPLLGMFEDEGGFV